MIAVRYLHRAVRRTHLIVASVVFLVTLLFLTANGSRHRWTKVMRLL